jgi:hypothetical protein
LGQCGWNMSAIDGGQCCLDEHGRDSRIETMVVYTVLNPFRL